MVPDNEILTNRLILAVAIIAYGIAFFVMAAVYAFDRSPGTTFLAIFGLALCWASCTAVMFEFERIGLGLFCLAVAAGLFVFIGLFQALFGS